MTGYMESVHLFDSLSTESKQKTYKDLVVVSEKNIKSCQKVQFYSNSLSVIDKLEGFSASLRIVGDRLSEEALGQGYFLLIINFSKSSVTSTFYPSESSETAEKDYIQSEKKSAEGVGEVVALVSTSAVSDIK